MSLNWDLTNIKNYKELCWVEAPDDANSMFLTMNSEGKMLNPKTFNLIWASLATSIGYTITEENVGEFYYRIKLIEHLSGTDYFVTPQDIRDHIGLHTNVSHEKRASWQKRQLEIFYGKMMLDFERELSNAAHQ